MFEYRFNSCKIQAVARMMCGRYGVESLESSSGRGLDSLAREKQLEKQALVSVKTSSDVTSTATALSAHSS
jgi:hypothetical protein